MKRDYSKEDNWLINISWATTVGTTENFHKTNEAENEHIN